MVCMRIGSRIESCLICWMMGKRSCRGGRNKNKGMERVKEVSRRWGWIRDQVNRWKRYLRSFSDDYINYLILCCLLKVFDMKDYKREINRRYKEKEKSVIHFLIEPSANHWNEYLLTMNLLDDEKLSFLIMCKWRFSSNNLASSCLYECIEWRFLSWQIIWSFNWVI